VGASARPAAATTALAARLRPARFLVRQPERLTEIDQDAVGAVIEREDCEQVLSLPTVT
jgi:hypothetical protein